ncbi:MAG: ribosome silencing factor [Syntrophobacteraceae bacterium]|jgi:ribosome-associated protein
MMPDPVTSAEAEQKGKAPRIVMGSKEKAILCARAALSFKALNLVVLDVSRLSSFADYFIICSGKSGRQVQGIADNLEDELRHRGLKPIGTEGKREGHWVLLDYGDVIIHVFYDPVRYFYDLESLWSDAARLELEQGSDLAATETD